MTVGRRVTVTLENPFLKRHLAVQASCSLYSICIYMQHTFRISTEGNHILQSFYFLR